MKLDQNGLYENFGPWHQPFWQTDLFFWSVMAFFVLIVALLVWLIIKRIRAVRTRKKPWEIALIELQAVQSRVHKNDATLTPKQAYLTLTWILKKYLHGRYQIEFAAITDQELSLALSKIVEFPKALMPDIIALEQAGVAAKFANEQRLREQIDADIERSIKIIKQTMETKAK